MFIGDKAAQIVYIRKTWPQIVLFVIEDHKYGLIRLASTQEQKKVVHDMADLWKRHLAGEVISPGTWEVAIDAAYMTRHRGAADVGMYVGFTAYTDISDKKDDYIAAVANLYSFAAEAAAYVPTDPEYSEFKIVHANKLLTTT